MNIDNSIAFYVAPKSFEDLEKHIREKYAGDDASIQRRLSKAKMDLEISPLFKHVVCNDDPQKAYEEIKAEVLSRIE